LGILSSILHGHPAIPPLTLDSPLAGMLLIGPWVTFSNTAASFHGNALKDIHGIPGLLEWEKDFLTSPEDKNKYSEPLQADAAWWKNAPAKKFFINWGEYELFQADNAKFANILQEAGLDVTAVECPREVHIECILDAMARIDYGLMATSVWDWLAVVF
jgi:acetyl esterase/lipase